jgi:hypothetical protein
MLAFLLYVVSMCCLMRINMLVFRHYVRTVEHDLGRTRALTICRPSVRIWGEE